MNGRSPTPINYGPDGRTTLVKAMKQVNARGDYGNSRPRCESCIRCLKDLGQQAFQKYLMDHRSRQIMRHESQQVPASMLNSLTPLDQARWIATADQRCDDCETPLIQLKMEALSQALPSRHERAASAPGGRPQPPTSRIPAPSVAKRSDSLKGNSATDNGSSRHRGFYTNQPNTNSSVNSSGCYPAFAAGHSGIKKSFSFGNNMFASSNPGWNSSYDLQSSGIPPPRSGSDFGLSSSASSGQVPISGEVQAVPDSGFQPHPSSNQLAAAASFFARAGQKMHNSTKKKRRSSQSSASELAEGLTLKTRFSSLLRTSCPPVPPNLLRPSPAPVVTAPSSNLRHSNHVAVGKVKVLVRVRHLETGKGSDATACIGVDQRKKQITLFEPSSLTGFTAPSQRRASHGAPKMFALDAVFTEDDALTELCSNALTDIVQAVVDGTDGCLFCFGHAKLGKTYTMIGDDSSSANLGIIPCAIAWIFKVIDDQKDRTAARFSVRVSAVEVHGKDERLTDLLAGVDTASDASNQTAPGMYLRDDPISGTQLQNQSELRTPNAEKAALYLDAALAARSSPESEEEGRMSHMLFTIHVYQYRVEKSGNGSGVAGGRSRLHLIDLGSGRVSKDHSSSANNTGATPSSTSSSDSSALSLPGIASVLQALATGQRHIPHRDSKLSQLLKEAMASLSCRTCMIVQVSSNLQHYNDSLQVVQLASKIQRLRRRKNRAAGSSASSDDSSSCDSFGLRRAGRGARPQMGLLRTSALTSASEADYTSSSEQSCDTVIYLGRGGEMTDGEGPPPLIAGLQRRRSATSGSCSDQSDSSQKGIAYKQQLRSPLAGKKAAPRTNALAWPRAAVKNAIETLSTQKEQWVDGPRAVYAEFDDSVIEETPEQVFFNSETNGQQDQITNYELSSSSQPTSSCHLPPLYSFTTSNSDPIFNKEGLANPPPPTQPKIPSSQESLNKPVTLDKETQSEEPYESESSPTTSSYSTLDRKNNRVLSDISERTEDVDTTPNDSEKEQQGFDDDDEEEVRNDVLDSIEPPPLLASGTPTLDTSLCGTMGSAQLLINEDTTLMAAAFGTSYGSSAVPLISTSQVHASTGTTNSSVEVALSSGGAECSNGSPQLPTSNSGDVSSSSPLTVPQTSTTVATTTTSIPTIGTHHLPRVNHFVRDWVEKHSVLATTAVLGDETAEVAQETPHHLNTSTHSSPGHGAQPVSSSNNADTTSRSTPRHHTSADHSRRHHRTGAGRKGRDSSGVEPPPAPMNQPAVSLARVAQWVESVNLQTGAVENIPTRTGSNHPAHHRLSQHRVPYQPHHEGGSLDRHHYHSGTAAPATSELTFSGRSASTDSHDRRGRSVPPNSVGSEHETENQRIWYTAAECPAPLPQERTVCSRIPTPESGSRSPACRRPDGASNPHLNHELPSRRIPASPKLPVSHHRSASMGSTAPLPADLNPKPRTNSLVRGSGGFFSRSKPAKEASATPQQESNKISTASGTSARKSSIPTAPTAVHSNIPGLAQSSPRTTRSGHSFRSALGVSKKPQRSSSGSPVSSGHSSGEGGKLSRQGSHHSPSLIPGLPAKGPVEAAFITQPTATGKSDKKDKVGKDKCKLKESKTKETKSRLSSFLSSPIFGKKKVKDATKKTTSTPISGIRAPSVNPIPNSNKADKTNKTATVVQGGAGSHKRSSSIGGTAGSCVAIPTLLNNTPTSRCVGTATTSPAAAAMLVSPYSTVTPPRACGPASSGRASSDCSGMCPPGCGKGGLLPHHHTHTGRTGGCGHASSGYESMIRDSELSSHNDSTSESSVAGLPMTAVNRPHPPTLMSSVSSSKTKNNSRSASSTSSRRSCSAPPRSAASDDNQSPASTRRLFPPVWTGMVGHSNQPSRLHQVENIAGQIRYEKIHDLLAQQAALKEDLVNTRERLMVDPASWSLDLYVAEQMDLEDPSFLEALSKETQVLQKRVNASKSHVMMVTCFDAKGALTASTSCMSNSRSSSSCLLADITGTTVVM